MGEAQEQRHLAKAEADVANADDRIERQRAIVAKLKNDGHPTDTAEKILATMLRSRNAMEAHRRVILETLALYHVDGTRASSPPSKDVTLPPARGNGRGKPGRR